MDADLADVRINPIRDRVGQLLRNALVQRITPKGEPGDPIYTLKIILSENAGDLGYRKDTFATLGSLTLQATVLLQASRTTLISDTASTVVTFDYLGPRYASVSMERDAEERAVTQLADDIRSRVALAIARYKANPNDIRYRRRSGTAFGEDEQPDQYRPLEPAAGMRQRPRDE